MLSVKTVNREVRKYVPECEIGSEKPTTICFRPLSKREYESYSSSLVQYRKGEVVSKMDKAYEVLLSHVLCADEKGVFVYNAMIDNTPHDEVKVKDLAVKFLMEMEDLAVASEIEMVMRGASSLTETEAKN